MNQTPTRSMDGFLTRKAKALGEGHEVWKIQAGEREQWVLRKPEQPEPTPETLSSYLGLGEWFSAARQTIYAMLPKKPKTKSKGLSLRRKHTR